jgi:hypothetical protein
MDGAVMRVHEEAEFRLIEEPSQYTWCKGLVLEDEMARISLWWLESTGSEGSAER